MRWHQKASFRGARLVSAPVVACGGVFVLTPFCGQSKVDFISKSGPLATSIEGTPRALAKHAESVWRFRCSRYCLRRMAHAGLSS